MSNTTGPAVAPAPGPAAGSALTAPSSVPPPPYPPPPPETSLQGNPVITLNNIVSDGQITTNLYLMSALGVFCIIFFICFRRGIKLYQTRLYLANVAMKPPVMSLSGHRLLWSWMVPIWKVSDDNLIKSCGLDSLMIVRVAQLGVQLFIFMTVLGCIMLLPMYTKQNYLDQQHRDGKVASPSTGFSRGTMSNIPRGSALFWIPFVYVYIVLFFASWLLRRHYKEYARLRTQYIIAGEVSTNDWHEAFLKSPGNQSTKQLVSDSTFPSRDGGASLDGRDDSSAMTHAATPMAADPTAMSTPFRRMFSHQERASDPGSIRSRGFGGGEDEFAEGVETEAGTENGSNAASPPVQPAGEDSIRAASISSRALDQEGHGDSPTPLLQRLANRKKQRSVGVPGLHRNSREASPCIMPYMRHSISMDGASSRAEPSPSPQDRTFSRVRSFLDRTAGPFTSNPTSGIAVPPPPTEQGVDSHMIPDNVLEAAPSLPTPSEAGAPTPNYVEQRFIEQAALARASEHSPSRRPSHGRNGDNNNTSVPPPEMVMSPHENGNASGKRSSDAGGQMGISKYETKRADNVSPGVFEGQIVYKWWQAERDFRGRELAGKPNVWARKVVNTVTEDGETVGVMAQHYVVLVEGVPNPLERQNAWRGSPLGHVLANLKKRQKSRRDAAIAKAKINAAKKKAAEIDALPDSNADERVPRDEQKLAEEGRGTTTNGAATLTSAATLRGTLARHLEANMEADEQLRVLATATSLPSPDYSPGRSMKRRNTRHSRGVSGDRFPFQSEEKEKATAAEQPDTANGTVDANDASMEHGQFDLTSRQDVVNEFFTYLFPGSFQMALPVLEHKAVDILLYEWDEAASQLELAEARYEASDLATRPQLKVGGCCGCGGRQVDAINHWAELVRDLETQVGEARQTALRSEPTASFFVFFNDQAAAATAAQVSLQSEDGRQFRVSQAPGPEEVNWPTLWKSFRSRNIRRLLVLIPIAAMIVFPIGIFAGSISQLSLLLCGSPNNTAQTGIRWDWYCRGDNYLRKIVTGVLPPLILTFWQGIVVPRWFYYWCQAERRAQSFTQLDQRILSVFFWWSVINVFLGAMLGGSIFSQFRVVLEKPGQIPNIIGTALPTSSNFFINYVIVQALAIIPFRYMFPHMGIFPWVFRACGFNKSLTQRQKLDKLWPHSARGSKEIAFMILIYVIGLAYAAVSPIILPFVLIYFCLAWTFWRYAVLYFFERCYESGGRLYEKVFSQVVFCLFIFEAFTAAVFFANSAWYQGSILLATATLYLYEFHKWTVSQYVTTKFVPLESAIGAPLATVDPLMYIPPALRHGCAGWYPEVGKAWEAWNATVYTI